MPSSLASPFTTLLAAFAADLTAKFAAPLHFNPEDQLKAPIIALLRGAADQLGLTVEVLTEVQDRERSGRPDVGVVAQSLLAGYVELKAPGKGADPAKFKANDKTQWEKFRDLPNLIYTDGNQWALYRGGERVGRLARLSGDVTVDGNDAVSEADAAAVFALLRDFLLWQPTAPATPRAPWPKRWRRSVACCGPRCWRRCGIRNPTWRRWRWTGGIICSPTPTMRNLPTPTPKP